MFRFSDLQKRCPFAGHVALAESDQQMDIPDSILP